MRRRHDRVADRRAVDLLDARHDVADFAGAERFAIGPFRAEAADAVDELRAADRLDDDAVALGDAAVHDAHQRHDAEIVVEPRIDDQRLQRRVGIALRRRYLRDQLLQQFRNAQPRSSR